MEKALKLERLNGCRDPELVERIGTATALETRATGISYVFAPCIAVCRDPRWGRCYESYSEEPEIVREMTSLIDGLQGRAPPGWDGPYLESRYTISCFRTLKDQLLLFGD